MARLKATDVDRFIERLRAPQAATSEQAIRTEAAPEKRVPENARAQRADLDAVAPALRSALSAYLGRDVTFKPDSSATPSDTALFFESAGSADVWIIDIDAAIAAAIADIAIGGTGGNVRHAKRARIGKQLAAFALQLMRAAAAQSGADEPQAARFASGSSGTQTAERATRVAGTLVLGDAQGALRVSLSRAATPAADKIIESAASERPARRREVVRPIAEPPGRPQPKVPAPLLEPARKQPAHIASNDAFEPAVEAATARLADTARCSADLETMDVERVDTPSLARGDLKLALIAGGQGSLVLSADKQTVASVAAAVLGQDDSNIAVGAVGIDAVEAVLRASMRAFADRLPAIAGTPPRFVRLADGALPARSPHFEIIAPVRIGERAATLRWLVPAWMAGSPRDGRSD
ncbi:MAG: hypothetical protein JO194_11570 [Candidatus Eremiobacteraeota bacterium]|nr:hypothetical protein [Candidatus Eremiobacteraeota bacterium]